MAWHAQDVQALGEDAMMGAWWPIVKCGGFSWTLHSKAAPAREHLNDLTACESSGGAIEFMIR